VRLAAIKFVRKIGRLSWQDRLLLVEAFAFLAVAGLAIAVLPFRYLARVAARSTRRPQPPHHERLIKVKRIRWAILATAQRVPWPALCFQQGLAAQFMLRQQGIPSVLYYGVAHDDQGALLSHVWVCDGEMDVVGGEIAHRFAVLAMFPPPPSNTGAVSS
jgi:hypothetical protein